MFFIQRKNHKYFSERKKHIQSRKNTVRTHIMSKTKEKKQTHRRKNMLEINYLEWKKAHKHPWCVVFVAALCCLNSVIWRQIQRQATSRPDHTHTHSHMYYIYMFIYIARTDGVNMCWLFSAMPKQISFLFFVAAVGFAVIVGVRHCLLVRIFELSVHMHICSTQISVGLHIWNEKKNKQQTAKKSA